MRTGSAEGGRFTAWVVVLAVAIASLLFAIGVALFFLHGGAEAPLRVRGIPELIVHALRGSAQMQPRGFIEAGLLVLLLAPFLRLVAGVVNSARQRDWLFVGVGVVVVALLLTGIFLGTR